MKEAKLVVVLVNSNYYLSGEKSTKRNKIIFRLCH